jgi:MFS family permease
VIRDPYRALRYPACRGYLAGHVLAVLGQGILAVAVGWELYDRTGSAAVLGLVGLVQVVPLAVLVLPAGQVVDLHDRRRVLMAAEAVIGLAALGLAAASVRQAPLPVYYGLLALYGAGRTFQLPAKQAILPRLVPIEAFTNAVAWNSGGWQAADVVGPAVGGALIALTRSAAPAYLTCAVGAFAFAGLLSWVRLAPSQGPRPAVSWRGLLEGVRFVRRSPVLLAAMSLDLFAVLLGGVVALLPVFAKDILEVGPAGLGWLRAAQSLGAVSTSLLLAHGAPLRRAGLNLLMAVAGFGGAIITFGLSRSFVLSFAALLAAGAFDGVSVVIRLALTQLQTPDPLRGRVSAVNSLFIGMSNELGEFESGMAASLFGPIVAVVGGGVAVIGVVGVVARAWPEVLRLDRLEGGLAATPPPGPEPVRPHGDAGPAATIGTTRAS